MSRSKCLAVGLLTIGSVVAEAQTAPVYTQSKSISIGAPERWDYLTYDQPSGKLFVSHGDRIEIIDGETGAIGGTVTGVAGGTHGIGVSHGKGYTDDGKAGEVIVFDPSSFKIISHIPAKPDADGIVVDPKTSHVFVVEGDPASLSVIDAATDKVVADIDGGGKLEFAVADGRGKIYVNGAGKRDLVRIDTAKNVVDAHWPIPDCENPHGLAIDTQSHRLFVSCVNKLMTIVNADSGAVVTSLPIGAGTDAAAFDPVRKRVFSSNGIDGTITVIQEKSSDEFAVLGDIKTAVTARTMTINPKTGRLYLTAADIDPSAPIPPGPDGRPGRPKPLSGSTKVLFLDPK